MSQNLEEIRRVISDFPTYAGLLKIREKEKEDGSPPGIVPFVLNPPQQRYYDFKQALRAKSVPVRILILKYRQGGFTTYEQAESYWMAATRQNMEILTMAHTDDSAVKIFQMVQLMHDKMAPEFKPARKRDSSRKLQFPRLRSNFEIATAGSEKIGITLSKAHLSEAAYYADLKKTLNLLKEAIPKGAELVLESTANGFNEFETLYSGADDLFSPRPRSEVTNAFYRFFIRWFDDPQYQFPQFTTWQYLTNGKHPYAGEIKLEEKLIIDKYGVTPMQIAWRRWKMLEFGGDIEEFWEKYPEDDIQCFISSGKSYFNIRDILSAMIAWAGENPPIEIDSGLGLKCWEKPDSSLSYTAGADPAQGLDHGDGSAFHIQEEKTGRTVLTLCSKSLAPHEFARVIHRYCLDYNNAFLVVERNNHGHTVLSELMNHLDYNEPWQIYHHHPYYEEFKPLHHQIQKEFNYSYEPGFPTKSNTKAMLLDGFKKFIEEYPEACPDKDTIGEIKTFKRLKGGKLGAEPGKCDDRVIAFALSQWGRSSEAKEDSFANSYRTY